jgi:DNA-binding NarL/FixJ family response regulator
MTDPTTDSITEPSRPRVVLVDDHGMFRAGVRAEIGAAVDIVGEAASVDEAVAVINRTAPEVVLLDVHLPAGGGPAVVAATLGGSPNTRFLALSVSDAAEDVISVIRAGARGYVTKTISGPDLIDAIRRVADGDVVFSPRLAGFVLDAFRDGTGPGPTSAASSELDQLTPREQEVLRLLARGYSYREIGSELFISIKTVETHASNVLRKLQLSSRHQLTRWAADRRIV